MIRILKYKLSAFILVIITLLSFQTSAFQPSTNEMQTCQGVIDFIVLKLDNLSSKYKEDDIEIIQNGLIAYNSYIQKKFISPSLLKFSKGNINKADRLQKQVNVYREKIVKSYQNQYPINKLDRGFVESLNKCTQKTIPSGNDLAILKISFVKILELIKKQ